MAPGNSRHRNRPPRLRWWMEAPILVVVLVLLAILYVAVMNATIDAESQNAGEPSGSADALYFALHGLLLVVALAIGVLCGAWLRRSTFAIASLAAVWLVSVMLLAQVATFHLACEGRNDIIRHWHCDDQR